ncbi:MAG: rhodanese-like domain-containing protein [Gammaproteobacteria bacterium]|jgi:rhodanese-related sulfurtransferase|nr:rhodanese-like domain-containing protein [Gammaproteobacteria bacterium]
MENFGTFILDNWYLFLALIVIVGLLFVNLGKGRLLGFREVGPSQAVELINHENALALDIRSDEEFAKGHVVGSINIPFALLDGRMDELQRHRERKLLVCCESGRQAAHACARLRSAGFESVHKLSGGLMAWRSAGLPLERGATKGT